MNIIQKILNNYSQNEHKYIAIFFINNNKNISLLNINNTI